MPAHIDFLAPEADLIEQIRNGIRAHTARLRPADTRPPAAAPQPPLPALPPPAWRETRPRRRFAQR